MSSQHLRRPAGVLVVTILAALPLAACSGPDSGPSDRAPDQGESDAPATIRFAAVTDPTGAEAFYEEELARFEEEHPQIQVELTMFPADQYPNALQLAQQDGSSPDVMRLTPRNNLAGRAMADGWLLPLDEYADEDFTGTFPDGTFDPDRSDLRVNDELYAVPFAHPAVPTRSLLYNPALLDEAGFDDPPETWEDLAEMAQTITDEGGGQVFGYADMGAQPAAGATIQAIVPTAGPLSPIGVDYTTGRAAMSDDALVASVHFLRDLNQAGTLPTGWESWKPQDLVAAFAREQVAMLIGPSYFINEAATINPSIEVGVAPVPVPASGRGGYSERELSLPYWAISATTEHPDAAWELVSFLSGEDHHANYYERFKIPTSIESAWVDEAAGPILSLLDVYEETTKDAPHPEVGPPAARELVNRVQNEFGGMWFDAAVETVLHGDDFGPKAQQLDTQLEAFIDQTIDAMNAEGTWGDVTRDLITFPDWNPLQGAE